MHAYYIQSSHQKYIIQTVIIFLFMYDAHLNNKLMWICTWNLAIGHVATESQ